MVKRPQIIATRSFINMSQSEYQKVFEDQAKEDFGPFHQRHRTKEQRYIRRLLSKGIQYPTDAIQLVERRIYPAECPTTRRRKDTDLGRLFRHPSEPRYCAIWGPNPDKIAWNIDAVDEGGDKLQQRFEAMTGMGARPALS